MGLAKYTFIKEKKCYEKFVKWAKNNRYIVDERDDVKDDLVWLAWQKAWVTSRSVILDNQFQKERNNIKNYRLTDKEKRDLWIQCSSGKNYGELIELKILRKLNEK